MEGVLRLRIFGAFGGRQDWSVGYRSFYVSGIKVNGRAAYFAVTSIISLQSLKGLRIRSSRSSCFHCGSWQVAIVLHVSLAEARASYFDSNVEGHMFPATMPARQAATADLEAAAGATLAIRRDQTNSGYDDQQSTTEPCPDEKHMNRTTTGPYSEHGHSLSHIRPMAKHSGSSISAFFNGLFQTIIAVSTLGTSITFSYVLSNDISMPSSRPPTFAQQQIREFLAISWLLFLLALAFASLGSTFLTFFKNHWIADWNGTNGKTSQWTIQMYAVVASGLLGGLTIGAFALLCLVVVAFSAMVGWVALGFTAFFGLVILFAVVHQVPWPWRDNTPSPPTRHHSG